MHNLDLTPALHIIERENTHPGALIPVLQKTQAQYGYLPPQVLKLISRGLNIPLSRVLGTATFYSQFRFQPVGKYIIKVCHGTACHISGAERVSDVLKETLGIDEGQTTTDMLFTLERVACLGCCSLAPVMMINETTYGMLTPGRIKKVINEYKKR